MDKPIPEAARALAELLPPKPMPGEYYSFCMSAKHATELHRCFEALTAAQQPVQEGGGVCPKCRGTGEVCTGYIDGTPEMFDCTCPAAAPPSAPVGVEAKHIEALRSLRNVGVLYVEEREAIDAVIALATQHQEPTT